MGKKQPNMNVGAAILLVIFSLLFFILIYRYASIQISGEAAGETIGKKAQLKYEQERIIDAKRGTIFDKNGEVIAEDAASYTLVAILDKSVTTNKKQPKHVKDPKKTAIALARFIDLPESEIYRILTKKGRFQVEFGKSGKDISQQTKQEITDLKLPGITFYRDSKRFYPNGIFASHLVGFVEAREMKDEKIKTVGTLGIEQSLNEQLTGIDGKINYQGDFWGLILPDGKEKISPASNGNNVYLTIDKKIQTFLEDALNKVTEEYKPKKIIAVVADPKTGEILAMGQRPSFHPKTKEGINESWHNEVIETSFEPGSTMKIFTLAAAINEKVFNPNEWYKSGSYKVSPKIKAIHDHNYVGWGNITYLEGVQRSSNVAFAKIANEKLGFERFRAYITKFGLDQPTGIDLPNETTGKIVFDWPLEKITTAFGQGSAVTPIQQIQAATAIANNGKMMKPHVIRKIVDADNGHTMMERNAEVVGQPITAETAKQVRDILGTVVTSPEGTGKRYEIEGYDVAGKTGTAQIPGPDGRYLTGAKNYIFSFLGMAPKNQPKLIVYVAVQQPEIDSYFDGSLPVSKVFKSVMKNSLQYMNIEPSKVKKADSFKIPSLKGKTLDAAKSILEEKKLQVLVLGNGTKIVDYLPSEGKTVLVGEKVVLKTEGDLFLPNLVGWSFRDSIKVAELAGLKLNPIGQGFVVKQNITPGSIIKKDEYLIINLKTPYEQFIGNKNKQSKAEKNDSAEIDLEVKD